jgi:hypothetical protein
MDLYTFMVEEFIITDTRAKHHDTLWLGYSAYVDGDMVTPPRSFKMGDFNNGTYSTVNYDPSYPNTGLARVVINDPTSKVAFIFQLLNAGNVPDDSLTGRIAATGDQLAGITAGLAGAGANSSTAILKSGGFWVAIAIEALVDFYSWLSVDCDGPVAIDQISGPRYVLDAWTDTPTRSVNTDRKYPGSEPSFGCDKSNYEVKWSLSHSRAWVQVLDVPVDSDNPFSWGLVSETGVSAAAHNGAVHAFGVGPGSLGPPPGNIPVVTHAMTFTGSSWIVDAVGSFDLADTTVNSFLPVSAVSYDDRLYVFGILSDNSIQALAYTVDGGSWVQRATGPGGLRTTEPITTVSFRHRLYLLARDSGTNHLRMTSTADLDTYNPWVDLVEPAGYPPMSSVAAAALGDNLHIFGVYQNTKGPNHDAIIMHKSTADGSTWTGWDTVEGGAHPEGSAAEPMDVAAGIFRDRIYLATRWKPTNHIALNFSEDGANWSGWRIPQFDVDPNIGQIDPQFGATAAFAPVDNHLYIFAPMLTSGYEGLHYVWAY